jgi:hypothetical protein
MLSEPSKDLNLTSQMKKKTTRGETHRAVTIFEATMLSEPCKDLKLTSQMKKKPPGG